MTCDGSSDRHALMTHAPAKNRSPKTRATEYRHCRISDMFIYRVDVLEALLTHGVRPTPATDPEIVHEFVSDLYRYELRRLRSRLLRAEFPKHEYYGRVVALRNRYRVIALKPREWLAGDA